MDTPPYKSRIRYYAQPRAPGKGDVLYWMRSALRAVDNPALNFAAHQAQQQRREFLVMLLLQSNYRQLNLRNFWFMLPGLTAVYRRLEQLKIRFSIYAATPLQFFSQLTGVSLLVTEEPYLRGMRQEQQQVASLMQEKGVTMLSVDSEVVVPHQLVSTKQEYSAATIRPKITGQWLPYLQGWEEERDFYMGSPENYCKAPIAKRQQLKIPSIKPLPRSALQRLRSPSQLFTLLKELNMPPLAETPAPSSYFEGGEEAAHAQLRHFLAKNFLQYGSKRNDPSKPLQSNLSPYLHYGMISPLRVVWEVVQHASELRQYPKRQQQAVPDESLDAFLEEMVVRRELSKNFVRYNPHYDCYRGIPQWAQTSLASHQEDRRPFLYSLEQLEQGESHDRYWNAAQHEMLDSGKMHGYMRMYWGKKVIEWSPSPNETFERLLYLNDRYELDGQDENGYCGISWCFGTHDRPWKERPIFGKIRYMNARGLERKFRIKDYAQRWLHNPPP